MDNSNNDEMLNPESGKTDDELRPIDEQDSRSASKAVPTPFNIKPPKRREQHLVKLEKPALDDSLEKTFASPEPSQPVFNQTAMASATSASIMPFVVPKANTEPNDKPEFKQQEPNSSEPKTNEQSQQSVNADTTGTTSETRPQAKSAKNNTKMGIIGPSRSGKTYLFNALVHLTRHTSKSGALASYLDNKAVFLQTGDSFNGPKLKITQQEYSKKFLEWETLDATKFVHQKWYWLTLPYRCGLGLVKKQLEVEFLDAAGETLGRNLFPEEKQQYRDAYLDASIMVFCLPLWVAFPADNLSGEDHKMRRQILDSFHKVVDNYRILHDDVPHSQLNKVRSILALTMADDTRSVLTDLRDNWISPYMDKANRSRYNKILRKPSGVACYLANARRVSQLLAEEFEYAPTEVSDIPNQLNFGQGQPWLIPISAVDGDILESANPTKLGGDGDILEVAHNNKPVYEPYPVHVELTLLVTLCASENALM